MEELAILFGRATLIKLAKASTVLVLGLILIRLFIIPLRFGISKALGKSHQSAVIKILSYLLHSFLFLTVLSLLGLDLKILLGAAGIFTVAIGFASQTSASNLISGIFLVVERPFVIGDMIKVGDISGIVISIDLLSTRLRTFDNAMIRLPNEILMKSQISNITYFSIRRIDLKISISFNENIKKVEEVLTAIVDSQPLCLDEPRPVFVIEKFGESSIDIQYSFWALKENYLKMKNSIYSKVLEQFRKNNIEIPFPRRVILNPTDSQK